MVLRHCHRKEQDQRSRRTLISFEYHNTELDFRSHEIQLVDSLLNASKDRRGMVGRKSFTLTLTQVCLLASLSHDSSSRCLEWWDFFRGKKSK